MKVATYCRISTDEERQPFSLEAQAERLNAYIFSQDGWQLARTYVDQTSGKTLERPGLQQALREAGGGRYDLFLVYKVDRLARSTSGLAQILEQLQKAGVDFRSASEPFDTATAAGRMMVQMLGVFAEFEREMIVERTKMGLGRKAARGEWTGGRVPFGYRYDKEKVLLVPFEAEAPTVKEIFGRYVSNGWGSMAIAKWLNDRCDLTKNGAYWTPKKVIALLRNPTYIGCLPFRDQVYEAAHEPIVDRDLFKRANGLLTERGEAWELRRSNPSDYLLTSFLKCEKCGHGFIGTVAHGRNNTYRYYVCYSRQRHGTGRCGQERIPADKLEERVLRSILADLESPLFEEAAEQARADWEGKNSGRLLEIKRLRRKIDDRQAALNRYLSAFETGSLSEKDCAHRVKEVQKEIAVLEADLATLEAQDEAPGSSLAALEDLRRRMRKTLEQGTPQEVKELLACFVDELVVSSRSSIQPFFVLPGVRIVFPLRRRRFNHAKNSVAGPFVNLSPSPENKEPGPR